MKLMSEAKKRITGREYVSSFIPKQVRKDLDKLPWKRMKMTQSGREEIFITFSHYMKSIQALEHAESIIDYLEKIISENKNPTQEELGKQYDAIMFGQIRGFFE
jgi:hypothetical protein